MSELALTVFACGPRRDHECDSDGPVLCGGEDKDGNFWQGPDMEENRRRASWGSVTCSICGMSSMEKGMWE